MTSLDTNFNVSPYFDDYDEDKRFHRILFRPSVAVQARELTQLQTIIQKQIERFGNHIFKDGSVVDGVGITYYPNTHYLSLEDRLDANGLNTNTNFLISDIDSTYLITNGTDSNNSVRAVVKISKDGLKLTSPNTNRFYFDYIYTGTDDANNDVLEFSAGEKLYIYNSNQSKFGTLDSNNLFDTVSTLSSNDSFTANGYAYCIGTTDGIIFQKGYFSKVEPHIITVRDFSTNVSNYVVGFDTREIIIDEIQDTSLNDNALGYVNENAPGAHRLKLTPTLVSKLRTETANNTDFFAIVEFDSNEPTEQKDDPSYNIFEQQMARKTYEESGDYVVKPFKIETRVNDTDPNSFYYEISPGVGYVRGYRIEKIGTEKVQAPRAITTEISQNQILTANYGNYLICDEFLGIFDTEQLSEITFYDSPQNSISEYEGTSSSPTGSIVGKANVRAIIFEEGIKGTPSAKYLVYIFNIRMNSGKNFETDVKSLYMSGTFGNAKADVVLENNKAILKESNKAATIFGSGVSAVKRLTNNTGIGDTSYNYSQIKSGTMTSGGLVTISLDTAGPGTSIERLNQTTGTVLTGNILDQYNVYVSSNVYSANLTGNVSFTSGSSDVVGAGTNFTGQLVSNSNIIIYANSTQTYVRRVVSITNNEFLSVDTSIPVSNTSTKFGKYFVTGTPLPLANVTINSNTSFTANLGLNINSTTTVYCEYPVNRNQAVAITKSINKNRFVKIDCSNNVANSVGPWVLGLPDVHKLRNVYVGTTYSETNPNRTTWFNLDTGQRDSMYDHARLLIKPEYASNISASSKILVELDHFTANTSSSVGFFSVESYPIDDANPNNTSAIQTIEFPKYKNVNLRNIIDFRVYKSNTAVSSTNESGATINPEANLTSFSINSSGQYLIIPDTNFTADFEYYLPRYDLITFDPIGNYNIIQGTPSSNPTIPFVENDQSIIAECFVPAYPTPTRREFDQYDTETSTKINLKTNRRYTMRDIGILDERIKRIEYYMVLSTLEQQAKDLTIPDANGLNRFKNGVFADPFNNHNNGNVGDFEYKVSIDNKKGLARPYFQKHDIDFTYKSSNSSNIQRTGPLLSLPYSNEKYISQRFATKIRNTTESVWQWNGLVNLYPSSDFFRDEEISPNVNVDLDLTTPWEQFAQTPFASMFGDWRDVSTSEISRTRIDTQRTRERVFNDAGRWLGLRQINTDSITSETIQQQIINTLSVDSMSQNIDLGSYVQDISIQPYMRSRLISFVAYNMKPNTTLYPFFDDVNISEHCAPGVLSGITNAPEGLEDRFVNQRGNFGDALVSDSNGFVCGVFRIPAQTFRTGDRVFQLTNVDDLTIGQSAQITTSKATYTADNVTVTRGSTTINVRQPEISFNQTVNSRVQTTTTTETTETVWDPICQSFTITNIPNSVSGTFLSQVGVYFQSKDQNFGVTCYIVEMENNLPNDKRIIGKGYLPASSVLTSVDASVETIFTLEYPVYLLTNNDYAFIIQPDSNSPEYNIWVGETGGFDVATNEQVFSNPYSGIMFISANRKTWTAIQKEDIKFNLYRTRFSSLSGTAVLKNEDDEYINVNGFNKANTSLSIEIGDIVYTVNGSIVTQNTINIVANTLINAVSGRVQYINESEGELWLDSSTANISSSFSNTTNPIIAIYRTPDASNTSYINANTLIAYGNVASINNLKYHLVVPKIGTLEPSKTRTSLDFKGTSNSNIFDTTFKKIDNNNEYEYFDYERQLMSRSNEVNNLSLSKSSELSINLYSESDFVSPIINLSKKSLFFVENLINNDTTNEHTKYGNALSKYISKRIILKDGQEAEDLKVYLSAYRPYDSDIKVYAKFWNNQDLQEFDDKVWTELQYDNGGELVYSSSLNTKDVMEYEFSVPSVNAVSYGAFANNGSEQIISGTVSISNNSNIINGTGTSFGTPGNIGVGDRIKIIADDFFAIRTVTSIANTTQLTVDNGLQSTNNSSIVSIFDNGGNDGIVEYTNSDGSRFIGFKEVALKIVLLSSNPIRVPLLSDVRMICLQI